LIKSNIITDSKRIRTNPLKGNIKSNTLSRRAQIAKIPGKNQEKKISLHEKHLQINDYEPKLSDSFRHSNSNSKILFAFFKSFSITGTK